MVKKESDFKQVRDRHGELSLPSAVYWGIKTARHLENLPFQAAPIPSVFIQGLALVKKVLVQASIEHGNLDPSKGKILIQVCDEILSGQWHSDFVVDLFQPGAPEGVLANISEIVVNRAAEIAQEQADNKLSNSSFESSLSRLGCGQDEFNTAMRLSFLAVKRDLELVLLDLERLLRRKALEFDKSIRVGRIRLQDSYPISLGQSFNCWAASVERCSRRLKEASSNLCEINLGSGKIGTGLGADPRLPLRTAELLSTSLGIKFKPSDDPIRLCQSMGDFLTLSSILRDLCVELSKISNDIKLMSSGPGAGFAEINLPHTIPESSTFFPAVLPDRNSPTIADTVTLCCIKVIGNDMEISLAAQQGQLESNSYTTLIVHNLLQSFNLLNQALTLFSKRCIAGITVNNQQLRRQLEASGAAAALIANALGEAATRDLIFQAKSKGIGLKDQILDRGLMSDGDFDKALDYKILSQPGLCAALRDPGESSET